MTETLGTMLTLLGLLLIAARHWGAHRATDLYKRWGFDVTEESYRKQFIFVGIVLVMLGVGILFDLF